MYPNAHAYKNNIHPQAIGMFHLSNHYKCWIEGFRYVLETVTTSDRICVAYALTTNTGSTYSRGMVHIVLLAVTLLENCTEISINIY
jgi:hypothetical protein